MTVKNFVWWGVYGNCQINFSAKYIKLTKPKQTFIEMDIEIVSLTEENYDHLIEENYDDSENSVVDGDVETRCDIPSEISSKRKKKCPNRTETQFEFLKLFASQINTTTEVQRPDYKASAWELIANQLNAMGPPTHSINEWKKIWSEHKCKAKTIQISENDSVKTHQSTSNQVSKDLLLKNIFSVMIQQNMVDKQIQNSVKILSDLQRKMSTIVEEQKVLSENTQKIFAFLNSNL